jgi:hypothetical protein
VTIAIRKRFLKRLHRKINFCVEIVIGLKKVRMFLANFAKAFSIGFIASINMKV